MSSALERLSKKNKQTKNFIGFYNKVIDVLDEDSFVK